MTVVERKNALIELGKRLNQIDSVTLDNLCLQAVNQNNWFTEANVKKALDAWAQALSSSNVNEWLQGYQLSPALLQKVGLILAGNIPLVGLHDILSVIAAGHIASIKLSTQDSALIKFVTQSLIDIDERMSDQIAFVDQLKEAEAVIATGSDNTARYFKHYFGSKPHIIRQNRTSIAILDGSEKANDFNDLGSDIFTYYGLGCRNVSKIYIPEEFDLKLLIDGLMPYEYVIDHHKFRNNYDYNKSIYLVNGEPHLDSGYFLMRETEDLVSPISVLYYEFYHSEAQLALKLSTVQDKIQCMVSRNAKYPNSIPLGTAQTPDLWDYADGINTLEFLENLSPQA